MTKTELKKYLLELKNWYLGTENEIDRYKIQKEIEKIEKIIEYLNEDLRVAINPIEKYQVVKEKSIIQKLWGAIAKINKKN